MRPSGCWSRSTLWCRPMTFRRPPRLVGCGSGARSRRANARSGRIGRLRCWICSTASPAEGSPTWMPTPARSSWTASSTIPTTSGSRTWSTRGSMPTPATAATTMVRRGACWVGVPHPLAAGPQRMSGSRTAARSSVPIRWPRTTTPWWWVRVLAAGWRRGRWRGPAGRSCWWSGATTRTRATWLAITCATPAPTAGWTIGRCARRRRIRAPSCWAPLLTRLSCRPGTRDTAATLTPSAVAPGCTARRPGGSCPRTLPWQAPTGCPRAARWPTGQSVTTDGAVLHPGRV